ncbi:MAG: histidinol-phosphate aminotransferase family protein [Lachnospiraceae bacterium]|nr:histidinol-phosphate aminotransferase family protein [Lachnospiraceae bacterium]MBQ2576558.1 histidinol-phosphate aminotransferase family protein [Lachnospiraceae bacterium]MCR4732553.1 histidinol-phosphate aminotransferase family protein [Lachnospiraceae bacterium]MEE3354851.1 histidinol-phosphate transaminase [Candidatus Weimeria sp.]
MKKDVYVDPDIKKTYRVFPGQNRYDKIRLDMNENPEGLPKYFVDEVLQEITPQFLSVYPEPDRFLHKYADFIGVDFENVVATNGSDMAIRYILETFGEKGKDVVTVTPSFEMYWVNCSILGYNHVAVPYNEDMTIDMDEVLDAITRDTRVVVLLNPNNPVGNVYTEEEVQSVIDEAEKVGAVVVIDEAYHYFYPNTFLRYALERDNVIILRTFSKLLSLAACRLGVVISNPDLIHYIKNAKLTFDANSIALLFAERLIERPQIIEGLIQTEREGRDYLMQQLQKRGYACRDCQGNYVLMEPKTDPKELAKRLEEKHGVLIHTFGNELLKKYLRISTGSKNAMELFLDALDQEDV